MTVSTVAPTAPAEADSRRGGRYAARHVLWGFSDLKRVRSCGRVSRSADGVGVRITTGPEGRSAGFSGLSTCGSVWACPVCSAKIAAGRQDEIAAALTEWHKRGGRVGLVTLTMRHRKGQALTDLWDGVADAWHAATSGRGWTADQDVHGVPMARVVRTGKRAGQTVVTNRIRTIRVVEVTHGDAGWHVHVHALVLVDGRASAGAVEAIGAAMFGRWSASLVSNGFDAPSFAHGLDARRLEGDPAAALGEYFTKSVYRASMETARGDLKDAKMGNRTPFAILRGLVEVHATGDLAGRDGLPEVSTDERLWHEWEAASKGRRQVGWTQGLRAELLPDVEELTDEELADQDQGGEEIGKIEPATWSAIARARADWEVLQAFVRSDAEGWALVADFRLWAECDDRADWGGLHRLMLPRPGWAGRP